MPASYSIDRERRLVVSRRWGVLTDEDLQDDYAHLAADPAFDPSFRQLIDLSEVTQVHITPAVVALTGGSKLFDPSAPRAFVAPSELQYDMARLYTIRAQLVGQTVQAFRSEADAREWLGV
jgi:hypothetical protein